MQIYFYHRGGVNYFPKITSTIVMFLVIFYNIGFSQEPIGSRICGNIIDAETREAIAHANVFISNSSIGCASDKNGYFEFRNIPYGRYEIIASVIGYELLKAKFGIYTNDRRNVRFEMYKDPIQFPEIIVSGKDAKKRKKKLQKFRRGLLGTSQNGKKTYIKNEDAIHFDRDKHGLLIASASEPLEIINNSLGYRIQYVLEEFEMTDEYVKYVGYPHFSEMTAKTYYDSMEWVEHREWTYTGSLRHFLTTICKNYEITAGDTTAREFITDWEDVLERGTLVTYSDTTYIEDQGFYVLKLNFPSDDFSKYRRIRNRVVNESYTRELLNTNGLLLVAKNDNEMYLKFDDALEVKYKNEYFPFEDKRISSKSVSWITLTTDSTVLDKQGRYFDIYAIKTTGLWSKERVADMLPFDYTIENK